MISNDTPIVTPSEDQFGIDPFAQAIAKAINNLNAPEGTVLALTGPWGSGKSSAANLIRHHLKASEDALRLNVTTFNPWWYSNEEMLTRSFFQHLYAGLGLATSEKARSIILTLSRKLLGAGSLISTTVNYFAFGFGGKIAESAAAAAAEFIKADRTVEEDFQVLAEELQRQEMKFLIVIDDIDRLTPEQTLLVFRLVKSVGRLPNVIYLLVFDRDLAERLLAERYPAERHFLEKIVQAAFEVPLPDPQVLQEALLKEVVNLAGHPQDQEGVRFRNVLTDVVNPLIALPRDLNRFVGNFGVSWAAIGDEVDVADLVAIESLRLFRLPVYQAIRSNKGMLCGASNEYGPQQNQSETYDAIFLSSAKIGREREALRTALRRLFPRLDSIWANVHHGSSDEWRVKRRICDPGHFPAYFTLALGANVLPRSVIEELLQNVADSEKVKTFFRARSRVVRKDGRSDVPIILDDLIASSGRIETQYIRSLLAGLFEVADELDLDRDEEGAAFGSNNQLRIHWLLNSILRDRLTQRERSSILHELLPGAGLGFAVSLTSRIQGESQPRENQPVTPMDERLVNEETHLELVAVALDRLRASAWNGTLIDLRSLLSILYRWREFSDGAEVRQWTNSQLPTKKFVLCMAEAVTSVTWVSGLGFDGMGDRVSRAVTRIQLDGLETILDVEQFFARLDEVERQPLSEREQQLMARFREGMRNREEERARGRRRTLPVERHDDDEEEDEPVPGS